jgi:hypothetical protein
MGLEALGEPAATAQCYRMTISVVRVAAAAALLYAARRYYRNWGTTKEECRATLAELGAHSPLVEDLARAVSSADWPTAHAIGEHLAIDVTVAV